MIVDAHGKGRSCEKFFHEHLRMHPTYLAIFSSGNKHHAMMRLTQVHEEAERLNYDLVGALYDVKEGMPLRAAPEFDLAFIRPAHECMEKCLEILPHFSFETFNPQVLQWAHAAMKRGLCVDSYVDHALHHAHLFDEDGSVRHFHTLTSGFLVES